MPNCRDCIHYHVCLEHNECKDFEDDSHIVKLPCEIGKIIYVPIKDRGIISEFRVKSFLIGEAYVWINWNLSSGIGSKYLNGINAIELGKIAFLTREEAEKELKQRDQQSKK